MAESRNIFNPNNLELVNYFPFGRKLINKINDELKSFLKSIGCKPARIKIKNGSA